MLPPRLARPARGVAAVVALVVLGACSADGGGDPSTSPSASSTPTRAPLTFEEATAALTETLLPTATVERCDEYEPGSPEAQAYLDQLAANRRPRRPRRREVRSLCPARPSPSAATRCSATCGPRPWRATPSPQVTRSRCPSPAARAG